MTTSPQPQHASSGKRLLFSCYRFYLDPSNGASITTREILLALAKRGWEVSTFCGCGLDFQKPERILQLLADRVIVPQQIVENTGDTPFSMLHFFDSLIPVAIVLLRALQSWVMECRIYQNMKFLSKNYDELKYAIFMAENYLWSDSA